MLTTSSRPAAIGLAVGSLAVLAGCQAGDVSITVGAEEPEDTTATDTMEVMEAPEAPEQPVEVGPLADGTYTVTGGYQSPNGPETVVVTLSIVDGIVTEALVEPQASNATSSRYQGQFAGGIASEVVGKALADVEVTRVAGSSLTGRGFNEALDQIRSEAQAAETSSSSSSY
jgi:hypothetical protein